MLRLLVALLLAANLAFYGWSQGWFDQLVGVRAQGDREPARMALQVEPQRVRVVTAASVRAAAAEAEPAGTLCLETGPFTTAQLGPAQAALQAVVPQNRIDDVRREAAAVWIVFMGPYADTEARRKKVDELRRLKINFEDIRQVPELGDGLSLGRFDNRAAAERAVADLTAKGVRTARVAQYAAPIVSHLLRVPDLTPAQQAQLTALQSPDLVGRTVVPCTR